MQVRSWVWVLFALMVLALLAVDLGLFRASRRAPQEVALRSAAWWSAAWIGLSLVFGLVILVLYGSAPALTYLTAYLLEKSLSVDNVFVFVLIFSELPDPTPAAASGPLLGRTWRPRRARAVDRRRRVSAQAFPLGRLPVRGAGHLRCRAHPLGAREGARAGRHRLRGLRQLGRAHHPDHARAPRRFLLGPRAWAARGHTALHRARRRRDHGRHLCPGLDPRCVCRHPGSVSGVHVQRLRDARAALALLPSRGRRGSLPLPPCRPRGHPRLRRREAALPWRRGDPYLGIARRHRRRADARRDCFGDDHGTRCLGTRSRGSANRLACTTLQSPALKNASRSALTWSLCVEGMPCGAPG